MRYIVCKDDKPISGEIDSLENAQKFAATHVERGSLLKIEGYLTNAPMSNWEYSHEGDEWIKCE